MSYLRSIHLHKDKSIFKIDELPVERFAESLGLPGMPKIKFLSKEAAKKRKNAPRAGPASTELDNTLLDSEESGSEGDDETSEDESAEETPANRNSEDKTVSHGERVCCYICVSR